MREKLPQYFAPLFTITAFVAEWYLLDYLMTLVDSGTSMPRKVVEVFLIPTVLCFIAWVNYSRSKAQGIEKSGQLTFLLPFIKIVRGDVGTINGIVNVLFILFNLAWTQDLILEVIKGDTPIFYPIFTAMFLVVPFVWSRKPTLKNIEVKPEERKFLIAAMSFNELKYNKKNEYIPPLMSTREGYEGWFSNSEPIRACFFKYPNLERVLLIQSTESHKQSNIDHIAFIEETFNKGRPTKKESITSISELIEKSIPNRPEVREEIIPDMYVFNNFFPALKRLVNGHIKAYGYSDEEVLFSITGATAVLSAGLVFLSMPGNRGCVYSSQDKRKKSPELQLQDALDEFDVNIYSIDELWNEIIEQSSGE